MKKITGKFNGIRVPRSIPVYDCRTPEDTVFVRVGIRNLCSSELAALDLGLLSGNHYRDLYRTPRTHQFYWDTRKPENQDLFCDEIRDARKTVAEMWREYRSAVRRPAKPGRGGSVIHKPKAVALCNYAISFISDERDCVVRAFSS